MRAAKQGAPYYPKKYLAHGDFGTDETYPNENALLEAIFADPAVSQGVTRDRLVRTHDYLAGANKPLAENGKMRTPRQCSSGRSDPGRRG